MQDLRMTGESTCYNGGSVEYELDASTLELDSTGVTELTIIDNTVSMVGATGKAIKIQETSVNNKTYRYINISGGAVTTEKNSLKLTITGSAIITVTATTSKTDGTTSKVKLLNNTGDAVSESSDTLNAATTDGTAGEFKDVSVTATTEGTYYIGGSSCGVRITKLKIEYTN